MGIISSESQTPWRATANPPRGESFLATEDRLETMMAYLKSF